MNELMQYCDKVYEKLENELVEGWVPVTIPELKEPGVKWKGALVPFDLYTQVVAFFRWVYNTHKTEAMVRLFYNDQANDWRAVPYPQEAHSAHVTEIENDKSVAILAQMGRDNYSPMATIHSHPDFGASQSGIDHADEKTSTGFHITLGYVNRDVIETHARFVLRGVQYGITMGDVIAPSEQTKLFAEEIRRIDEDIANQILARQFCKIKPNGTVFPEEWKEAIMIRAAGWNMANWDKKKWDKDSNTYSFPYNACGNNSYHHGRKETPDGALTKMFCKRGDLIDEIRDKVDDIIDTVVVPEIPTDAESEDKGIKYINVEHVEAIIETFAEGIKAGIEVMLVGLSNKEATPADGIYKPDPQAEPFRDGCGFHGEDY